MNRRNFIVKTSLGAVGAGSVLPTKQSNAQVSENSDEFGNESGNKEKRNTISNTPDRGAVKEVLKYTDKARSGLMIGGIGAGGAELRKDGIFYNWSIYNNNPHGSGNFLNGKELFDSQQPEKWYPMEEGYMLFFIVRYQIEGEEPQLRLLQIDEGYQSAGVHMHIYEFPWLIGIEEIEYTARFPFTNLKFVDAEMPLDISLEASCPFIPHDVKNSSLPVMNFNFKIKSKSGKPVDVMLLGSYRHLVGYDTLEKYHINKINKTNSYLENTATCGGMDTTSSSFGTVSFASLSPNSTYYLGWEVRHPYYEYVLRNKTLPNLDDTDGVESILRTHTSVPDWMPETSGRNKIYKETGKKRGSFRLFNSLAYSKNLIPGESLEHTFVMTWHFPNNYDNSKKINVGHYYDNFFKNSSEVMAYYIGKREDLSLQTKAFQTNFYDSSLPQFVLDQVNSHLNTFISSGVLGKKMEFGVIEGITKHQMWGPIGTTDVSMYGGIMISSLFPELAKSTMRVHKTLQHTGGEIRHSFQKGFAEAMLLAVNSEGYIVSDRLDLHAQYAVMVLRDFFWTDDKAYLQEMWPSVKKAIDYVLDKRDINGDQQPDMTGIMSSYDNFPMYGMASYIQSQWLCALASCVEAAKALGDGPAQEKYVAIYNKGKKLAEEKLWNGDYFRLYNSDLKVFKIKDGAGKEVTKDISGIGEGCLTDQLIGQWAARWSGLGDLFDQSKIKSALNNILEKSYVPDFGLRNCSWPGGKFVNDVPNDIWVDQGNTCWSGVELAFASFLLYEGMYEKAIQVIKTVDTRYRKSGRYFDHQEFGGHYFRPMSAWGIINGALGLSVNQQVYSISPKLEDKNFKLFFAFSEGTANLESDKGRIVLNILSGEWKCKQLNLNDFGITAKSVNVSSNGIQLTMAQVNNGNVVINFKEPVVLKAGQVLTVF